jgi:hypothetical protein
MVHSLVLGMVSRPAGEGGVCGETSGLGSQRGMRGQDR